MNRFSPSEFLQHVKDNLAAISVKKANDVQYEDVADIRKLFPYLAGYASGRRMFAPRVKAHEGYGLESFILFLASQCDGALARDGKGFDQGDADEGHRLAAKLSSESRLALTAEERLWVADRCVKYRQQLMAKYPGDYIRVVSQSLFLFAPAPDGQQKFVQHIAYNEASRSVSFSLPGSIGPRDQSSVMSELYALVRSMEVNLVPPLAEIGAKLRKDWERYRTRLTFMQSDDGGRDLVGALTSLGYTKDERIDQALDSGVTSYLRVAVTPGPDYEGRRLVGYLHCIAECPGLIADLEEFYLSGFDDEVAPRPAVNLSKRNGYSVLRVFIGDDVVDGLEEVLVRHGVQNWAAARMALGDPKRSPFQHPALQTAAYGASPAMSCPSPF
nr:hypothetical protein [Neorhizobium tomejilense]